jgi:uncharacterized membrane protein
MPMKLLPVDLAVKDLGAKLLPAKGLAQELLSRLRDLRLPLPGWLRRLGWRPTTAAVLLGGIVHICATFAAPFFSSGHAYLTVRDKLPVNQMVILPPQAPGRQILPFLPPDMLYAMCRYDLSAGPVAVRATVTGAGWALSLHAPQGENFYVLPGQPLRRTEVALLVVPGGPDPAGLTRRDNTEETQIIAPAREGLVVVRGPLRGLAWAAETEATLQRATCTPVRQ